MRKHVIVILIILTSIGSYFLWKRSPNQNRLQDSEGPTVTQQVSQPKNPGSLTQDNTDTRTSQNSKPQ